MSHFTVHLVAAVKIHCASLLVQEIDDKTPTGDTNPTWNVSNLTVSPFPNNASFFKRPGNPPP